ncbi:hypothetical protein [Alienimonas sp. DA493]|uniref:hypothetical protein n=1 Tax=Alienimonas sp. DA493 TaxID=3373605 RepID=UPI003754AA80
MAPAETDEPVDLEFDEDRAGSASAGGPAQTVEIDATGGCLIVLTVVVGLALLPLFVPGELPDPWRPIALFLGLPILAVAGLLYGVLPLKVRRVLALDATRSPTSLAPNEPFSAEDEAFLTEAERSLAPYGFGRTARLEMPASAPDEAPAASVRWALLTDPPRAAPGDPNLEAGVVVAFVSPSGPLPARQVVQITREYADGSLISVSNSLLDAPIRSAGEHVLVTDWLTEPSAAGDLWRAFEAAERAWRTAEPVHHPARDWADAVDRGSRRAIGRQILAGQRTGPPEVVTELREAARRGVAAPPVPPGVYPATRRLAYRMTWRGLWPGSAWGRRRERRRAVRCLRDWGLEDLIPG